VAVALAASSLLNPTIINPLPPRNPPDMPTHPAGNVSRSAVCMHCRSFAFWSHTFTFIWIRKFLIYLFFFSWWNSPPVGQGLLIIEALLLHSDTTQSVGLLWTSDHPDAEISMCQHTTLTTDRHPCSRRNSNPHSRQASGRRSAPQTALPLLLQIPSEMQSVRWLASRG